MRRQPPLPGMAPGPEKLDVKKAAADKQKLDMLKELAKLTKPTGKSAQGKSHDEE
jgi:hypothetical protein